MQLLLVFLCYGFRSHQQLKVHSVKNPDHFAEEEEEQLRSHGDGTSVKSLIQKTGEARSRTHDP